MQNARLNLHSYILATGKKSLALQAIPTQNLPQRLHEHTTKPERKHLERVKDVPLPEDIQSTKTVYTSLTDVEKEISKLKLKGFQLEKKESKIIFRKMMSPYTIPYVELFIDDRLEFTCVTLGWAVPGTHTLYRTFLRSVRKSTVSEILEFVSPFKLCTGLQSNTDNHLLRHVAPCEYYEETDKPRTSKVYMRTKNCEVLIKGDRDTCQSCFEYLIETKQEAVREEKKLLSPAQPNALLRNTTPERVTLAQQREKRKRKTLECAVKRLLELKKLKT